MVLIIINLVSQLSNKKTLTKNLSKDLKLKNGSFFSSRYNDLKNLIFIVTVPTPIFKNNSPDLRNLISVSNLFKKDN